MDVVFFEQSEWFLYLGIFCTILLRVKQDGVQLRLRYERTFFFNKRSRCPRHLQKSKEIWQLGFQRYVFLLFFSVNALEMFENVLFTNNEWTISRHLVKLRFYKKV